ncbi:MAG TPA: chromosomal replication initiator protein DnaA [Bacteroidota bacterium]|nr:chromosomal replication initiator protein DnaA [Bacteroidota bacterium]
MTPLEIADETREPMSIFPLRSVDDVWGDFLAIIKAEIGAQSFKTWFEPIKPVKLESLELTVRLPSHFFFDWLEAHYINHISGALEKVLGKDARLIYNVLPADDTAAQPNVIETYALPLEKPEGVQQHQSSSPPVLSIREEEAPLPYQKTFLNPRFTFDNYIKGESNQLARAAALAVANNPGGTSFNPLVLYGGTGLGKTHLIQAIGNYALSNNKARRVMYVSSEKFTIEFIDSIKFDKTNDFHNFYRSMDILIVDDIQFFSGKEKTQDSFFHTFNTLHQQGKQIILSSDRPAKELPGLDDRLLSRFQWGLTADIQPPDLETRTAILRKKCEDEGTNIPDDVIDYIAANVTSNVRELEGCYTSILFKSSLDGKEMTIDLAREVLRTVVNDVRSPLSVEEIQKQVAEYFDIPVDMLRAKTRKQEIVNARQIAMYVAKELTNCSLKTIGLHFGGRDHSTVIHAYQTVEDQMKTDTKFRTSIEQIRKKIEIASR